MLREMERVITSSPEASMSTGPLAHLPVRAVVDYYVTTPKGNRSRFANRGIALTQMRGNARSETAVRSYLMAQHPGCDVQINSISFE